MNEGKIFAPVIIFTLCRYDHFRECIESLSKCTHAEMTDVYVGVDYPLKESHWPGYRKICEYLDNACFDFKTLTIIKRPYNYGAFKNSADLKKIILAKYDRFILSEDDNVFSPGFLDYLNKGLVYYKDDNSVLSICAYMYPFNAKDMEVGRLYKLNNYSAWGFATWKDKYLKLTDHVFNFNYVESILCSPRSLFKLFCVRPKSIGSFSREYSKKEIWGDVNIGAYMLFNNKYSIFPGVSLVRNTGNDGTGIHCENVADITTQKIDNNDFFDFEGALSRGGVVVDKKKDMDSLRADSLHIQKKVEKYLDRNWKKRITAVFRYFYYYVFKLH